MARHGTFREWISRFVALAVMAFAVVCLVAPASAATNFHINFRAADTVPVEGAEFRLYRVIDGQVPSDIQELQPTAAGWEGYASPTALVPRKSREMVAQAFSAHIDAHHIAPNYTATTDSSGSVTIPDVEPGVYLVLGGPVDMPSITLDDGTVVTRTGTSVPALAFIPEMGEMEPKLDIAQEGLRIEKTLDENIRATEDRYVYQLSVWNAVPSGEIKDLEVTDYIPDGMVVDEILGVENSDDATVNIAEDRRSFTVTIPSLKAGPVVYITYRVAFTEDAQPGEYVNIVEATDHDAFHNTGSAVVDIDEIPMPKGDNNLTDDQPSDDTPRKQPSQQLVTNKVGNLSDTGAFGLGAVLFCLGGLILIVRALRERRSDDEEG